MSVHYTAPHSPWDASEHPKEYLDWYKDCEFKDTPNLPVHPWQVNTCPIGDTEERRKENLRGYYAAISAMDAGVGKILDKVKEKGLEDNTIVIFTSDNGMNMGHHGIWGKGNGTYPPNMYESSIRVPFIIKYRIALIREPNVQQWQVSMIFSLQFLSWLVVSLNWSLCSREKVC